MEKIKEVEVTNKITTYKITVKELCEDIDKFFKCIDFSDNYSQSSIVLQISVNDSEDYVFIYYEFDKGRSRGDTKWTEYLNSLKNLIGERISSIDFCLVNGKDDEYILVDNSLYCPCPPIGDKFNVKLSRISIQLKHLLPLIYPEKMNDTVEIKDHSIPVTNGNDEYTLDDIITIIANEIVNEVERIL